jgi:hypothetical protein
MNLFFVCRVSVSFPPRDTGFESKDTAIRVERYRYLNQLPVSFGLSTISQKLPGGVHTAVHEVLQQSHFTLKLLISIFFGVVVVPLSNSPKSHIVIFHFD